MRLRFEPTKFEETTIPNTMATLPGPSLATKLPKMIEIRRSKYKYLLMAKAQLRIGVGWVMVMDFLRSDQLPKKASLLRKPSGCHGQTLDLPFAILDLN